MSIISVYITFPDQEIAQRLVDQLLKEKLIACGNIFPIQSLYTWQDTIESENEYVSVVKTRESLWDSLIQYVEKNHPYKIPCIVKYVVETNLSYEKWVLESVKSIE